VFATFSEEISVFRLDGRTALITGGTQGVGAAIAEVLAKSGCDIVLHGLRDDDASRRTKAICEEFGRKVNSVYCDLAGPTAECVQTLFDQATTATDNISILVNNAGTYIDKPFLDMDLATYERTMRLNVASGYFLTQAFARRWVERKIRGRVLFTGSINGELAEPDHTAYDASKGAVRTLVRSLCVSLAPHGIRVNAIAPGLVVTPLTAPVLTSDPDAMKWMKLHTPNGEVPGPEVCGSAALFLLSDEADHIHGQTLLVDGGMSVWQQPDLPASVRGHL
jgi:NAD(P)-dependent dehydrogenase (short-subunit alcohol dehydrogenase family)